MKKDTKFKIPGINWIFTLPRTIPEKSFVLLDKNSNGDGYRLYLFWEKCNALKIEDLPGEHLELMDNGIWSNQSRSPIHFNFGPDAIVPYSVVDSAFTNDKIWQVSDLICAEIEEVKSYKFMDVLYPSFAEAERAKVTFEVDRIFNSDQLKLIKQNYGLLKKYFE